MNINESYNFRDIEPHTTSSGVVRRECLMGLGDAGYQVVINLLPGDHRYAVVDEKELLEAQGIQYAYIPVAFDSPKLEEYAEFAKILESIGDKKVHIHCSANWRASAFYGIYSVSKGIWTKKQARGFITDLWDPKEHPAWDSLLSKFGLNSDKETE